jgi:chromosome segregation ATPase
MSSNSPVRGLIYALMILVGALTYEVLTLPAKVGAAGLAIRKDATLRVDLATVNISQRLDRIEAKFDARDKQIGMVVADVDNYVAGEDAMGNIETSAAILREAYEIVHDIRLKTLPEVDSLIADLRLDASKLTGDAAPLKAALENVATLVDTLNQQIKDGAPQVADTAKHLTKVLADVDTLLSDPKLAETLAHVEGTTKNLESTTKSVDIYLMALRKKYTLLKQIIDKSLNMVKFTIPLWEIRTIGTH